MYLFVSYKQINTYCISKRIIMLQHIFIYYPNKKGIFHEWLVLNSCGHVGRTILKVRMKRKSIYIHTIKMNIEYNL